MKKLILFFTLCSVVSIQASFWTKKAPQASPTSPLTPSSDIRTESGFQSFKKPKDLAKTLQLQPKIKSDQRWDEITNEDFSSPTSSLGDKTKSDEWDIPDRPVNTSKTLAVETGINAILTPEETEERLKIENEAHRQFVTAQTEAAERLKLLSEKKIAKTDLEAQEQAERNRIHDAFLKNESGITAWKQQKADFKNMLQRQEIESNIRSFSNREQYPRATMTQEEATQRAALQKLMAQALQQEKEAQAKKIEEFKNVPKEETQDRARIGQERTDFVNNMMKQQRREQRQMNLERNEEQARAILKTKLQMELAKIQDEARDPMAKIPTAQPEDIR